MVKFNALMLSGIFVLVLTFVFLNVYITEEQKQEASQYDVLCNLDLGQLVQAFNDEAERKCTDMANLKTELDYGPIGYVVGIVLIAAGFFMSKKERGRN